MEPIAMRAHPMLVNHPEYKGKQYIIDCENGYGLSMVTASREHGYHGLYCDSDNGTYEICLIKFTTPMPMVSPFEYAIGYEDSNLHDVISWGYNREGW